nr:zinc finger, CCHC-type [Tanacetum cinerariifolium]
GFKQLGHKQVGFKQLGPGVKTRFHRVQDEKRVWFEVELQGDQGDRKAEVFQVSNDDTAVAQRRLEDKQLEEKINTDCLVKEQEKVHLGIKVRAKITVTGVPGQDGAEGNVAKKKKMKESMKANLRKLLKLLKIDVVPLASKLRNNRTAHNDYLKHTQEETATLREIVENERLFNPLNTSLDYTCKYTKRIQELLIILKKTCPCINDLGTKLMVVTLTNNNKQIRFTERIPSSGNTPVKTTPSTNVVSNTPVLSSTGVNLLSSTSGSQPQGNTKKDRIQQTQSKAKKNKLEDHPRTVKPSLNKKKNVVDTKAISFVTNSKLNVNSDLKCATCNGCLFSDNHDSCVLAPTVRTFPLVGNACPLTRITTTAIVPLRKPIPLENNTSKPVVTLVYSRKSKAAKKKVPVSNSKINKSLVVQIVLWYLDSKCSKHMTRDRSQLINFIQKFLGMVKFKNDHVVKIMGYGDYKIGNMTILRVYFVEGLGYNLFLVGQFCDSVSLEKSNKNVNAGSKDRPPMLAPGNYIQWKSRIKRYIDTKPNRELIYFCLTNPPYELGWKDKFVVDAEGNPTTTTQQVFETYKNVPQEIRDQLNAEAEAVQIILTRIDNDIYSTPEWQRFVTLVKQSQELKHVSYHKLYDILKQHQHEVNEIRAEKIARVANPLALVAQQQQVYHPQTHPTHFNPNSSTRTHQAVTKNRDKAVVNSPQPIYDQEPSMVDDDEDTSKDKEIDKLMDLISLSLDNSPWIYINARYEGQRSGTVVGARDTVGSSMVQKSRIQCYNCKEYGHVARERQKLKRVKDAAYHREKMLLCKQKEAGIQLNAKQADWKDDTDDESDDQELEAHYMYMAKLQQVSPDVDDSGPIFDKEPEQKVQNDDHYDVFAIEFQHLEQSESVHNTYLIEQDAQNVSIKSVDMNYNSEQIDQNDEDVDLAKEHLKAQLQDKSIAISELKKLIEKLRGKSVDTKFEKSSAIRQPNAFKSQRPSVLGKPTTFSNSFIRKDFSKFTSVTKNNVSNDFSKPVTAQNLPINKKTCLKKTNVLAPGMYKIHTDHTQARTSKLPQDSKKTNKRVSFSTGVIPTTSASRTQLKSNPQGDRVLRSNSRGKKLEVEEHRRSVKLLKNKMS